jgi:signal recognition particle subunit SRP54
MFENLTEKLQRAFKTLRGQGKLSEEHLDAALTEIRDALLEGDVNVGVADELLTNIRKKAIGSEVMLQLSPDQQVVKVVRDELTALLGKHAKPLFASKPPSVWMIVGLQGSGKTTTTGKLAKWLTQHGHRPIVVSTDLPPRTAHSEAPAPRWQVTTRSSRRGRPSISAARRAAYAWEKPWNPYRLIP